MKTYVFVGPTISQAEARRWLDATYLPPVSQGDIISLLADRPQAIGIIDGYFDSVPSVWHKEILLALSEGTLVAGAASMGALRAAELHTFGMVGVGEIFRWYRDGEIDADDEVALRHASGEHGYKPLSEPLVNVRKTLYTAHDLGIIHEDTLTALLNLGKRTHYSQRSYRNMLDDARVAGLPEQELSALQAYVQDHRIDLKKRDAVELLKYLASEPRPQPPTFELQRTHFLQGLADRDRQVATMDGWRMTREEFVDFARQGHDDFPTLKTRAAANALKLTYARRLGMVACPDDVRRAEFRFKESLGLDDDEALHVWARRNHLTDHELDSFLQELALLEKVDQLFSNPSNHDLLRQLRLENRFEELLNKAVGGQPPRDQTIQTPPTHGHMDAPNQLETGQAAWSKEGR